MIQMVAVAGRGVEFVFDLRADGVGGWDTARVLFKILLQELILGGFCECVDGVAGFGFAGRFGNRDAVADGEDAFRADETEAGTLAAAIHKIHA